MQPSFDGGRLRPKGDGGSRTVTLLGATGSIGRSTAGVVRAAAGRFGVKAVAGGRDGEALGQTAIELGASFAALADPSGYQALKAAVAGRGIECAAGPDAVIEAAVRPADIVVAAVAGTAGVIPTHAALAAGRTVALANKETLVCAGAPVMRTARAAGARLLPLDSEHNAIFQTLGATPSAALERMTITASGGPFRTWSTAAISAATPEQALAHPNWSMGAKVTIDSATLMNKGLELIEAHHLFAMPPAKLAVLVHPQSIVHGLVSFADGSVIACLAHPDMRVHIAHCLAWPERIDIPTRRLDLAEIGALLFEAPDFERFPALGLAMAALRDGGGLPTILNAANEIAVEAFLARRIGFDEIARLVSNVCEAAQANGEGREPATVAEALAVDHIARDRARAILADGIRSGMVTI
ncbi:MAG: 1-deoxy-D-xylulose-5-phosphate reductoisomerase [Methylobacteriaceae bacterium]|nr:1-deoxy-D-xylulose-5-phosphate reductoisomerase [Methylobacteriaceae bacterium]